MQILESNGHERRKKSTNHLTIRSIRGFAKICLDSSQVEYLILQASGPSLCSNSESPRIYISNILWVCRLHTPVVTSRVKTRVVLKLCCALTSSKNLNVQRKHGTGLRLMKRRDELDERIPGRQIGNSIAQSDQQFKARSSQKPNHCHHYCCGHIRGSKLRKESFCCSRRR